MSNMHNPFFSILSGQISSNIFLNILVNQGIRVYSSMRQFCSCWSWPWCPPEAIRCIDIASGRSRYRPSYWCAMGPVAYLLVEVRMPGATDSPSLSQFPSSSPRPFIYAASSKTPRGDRPIGCHWGRISVTFHIPITPPVLWSGTPHTGLIATTHQKGRGVLGG